MPLRVYNVDRGVMTDLLDLPVFEGARVLRLWLAGWLHHRDANAGNRCFLRTRSKYNVVVQRSQPLAPTATLGYADCIITMRYYEGQKPESINSDNSMRWESAVPRPVRPRGTLCGQLYYRNVSGER